MSELSSIKADIAILSNRVDSIESAIRIVTNLLQLQSVQLNEVIFSVRRIERKLEN